MKAKGILYPGNTFREIDAELARRRFRDFIRQAWHVVWRSRYTTKGGRLMPGGTREGAGRKATPIDLNELEKLCMMGCNEGEIAAWFKVSVRTIQTRRKQPRFAEAMRRGLAKSCINVRRLQFRLLEAGNATMAVWLGKNLLGQRDNMQITGAHGGPIQTENKPDFSLLNEDELRGLRAMLAKINGGIAK